MHALESQLHHFIIFVNDTISINLILQVLDLFVDEAVGVKVGKKLRRVTLCEILLMFGLTPVISCILSYQFCLRMLIIHLTTVLCCGRNDMKVMDRTF